MVLSEINIVEFVRNDWTANQKGSRSTVERGGRRGNYPGARAQKGPAKKIQSMKVYHILIMHCWETFWSWLSRSNNNIIFCETLRSSVPSPSLAKSVFFLKLLIKNKSIRRNGNYFVCVSGLSPCLGIIFHLFLWEPVNHNRLQNFFSNVIDPFDHWCPPTNINLVP